MSARLSRENADHIFFWSFLLLSIFQLIPIIYTPLGLAPDEAHYWEWSKRLDFSYYSKGPLIAYLIACGTLFFGDTEFALRFPVYCCFSLFSLFFYLFARTIFSPLIAVLGFFLVRSSLVFVQMGVVCTTDAPATLFCLLGIIAWYQAIINSKKTYWLLFGLALGLGVLAKYTVIFLFISVILFLIFSPQHRRNLISKEFILGAVLFIICLSPIVYWNYQHQWVNFAHNAGHVVKKSETNLTLFYLGELILGQFALVSPIFFIGVIYALIKGFRFWRNGDEKAGIFLFSCLPLLAFVVLVSLTKRVYANWPLPVYVGGFLLLLYCLDKENNQIIKFKKIIYTAFGISWLSTITAYLVFLNFDFSLPGKILPTKKLIGWKELGDQVQQYFAITPGKLIVFTDDYEIASEIAFYTKPKPQVYCANLDTRRMNQYDIWGGLEELKGENLLIVLKDKEKVNLLKEDFLEIKAISDKPVLEVSYFNSHLRDFYFFAGVSYSGRSFALPKAY